MSSKAMWARRLAEYTYGADGNQFHCASWSTSLNFQTSPKRQKGLQF